MYDLIAAEMTGVQFDNANGITVGGKPYNQAITVDKTLPIIGGSDLDREMIRLNAEMQKEAAKINEQISENQQILDDAEEKRTNASRVPVYLVVGVLALGVGMIIFKK